MTRDLDSKVISVILPDHGTVGDIEQILLSEFLSARKFNNIDVGGRVLLFGTLLEQKVKMYEVGCEKIAISISSASKIHKNTKT